MLIAGIVMLPLGLVRKAEHGGRVMAEDFPKMSNDMIPTGSCTVVGLWTRSVERQQGCGRNCVRKICYDDYVAEFGWVGGPTNNATTGMVEFGGMSTATSKVDMSQVDMTKIDVRVNTGCIQGCDKYGGWLLNATYPDRSNFTSVALSQGWSVERCRHCTPCGDEDPTDDNDHGAFTPADPWGFPEHPVPQATGIVVGDDVLCRIPAEGAANVPDSYDCPDPKFNSLCARLADLPNIELSGKAKSAQTLVTWGAVCFSLGMVPALIVCFVVLPDLLNFKKPRHHKKERVRHVVRQMSGKNMVGNLAPSLVLGAFRAEWGLPDGPTLPSAAQPATALSAATLTAAARALATATEPATAEPSAPGPAPEPENSPGGGDDKPAIATVDGVALSDASTAGMTTTSGVVVTGAPVRSRSGPALSC